LGGPGLKFKDIDGSTSITDISCLIPAHISTQAQLNEWEKNNIISAQRQYLGRQRRYFYDTLLFRHVHRDMFNATWEWAGNFRTCNYNLGIDFHQVPVEMKKLADDLEYWLKNNIYDILEQSVRLHHRLLYIHAFPNGNGRHARLVQDIFLFNNNQSLPQWPSEKIINNSSIRKNYIDCLKSADKGDYKPLLEFIKRLLQP
jgi:Fic-DOC domain mobile mystery protein B